ncbi:MAG: hypothetical protein ACK55I_28745, partial [bacterium]
PKVAASGSGSDLLFRPECSLVCHWLCQCCSFEHTGIAIGTHQLILDSAPSPFRIENASQHCRLGLNRRISSREWCCSANLPFTPECSQINSELKELAAMFLRVEFPSEPETNPQTFPYRTFHQRVFDCGLFHRDSVARVPGHREEEPLVVRSFL